MVLVDVVEPGQRVHDARASVEFCGTGAQNIALLAQSGSWPLADVVAPADVVAVKEPGQIRPGVVRRSCRSGSPGVPGGASGACTAGWQLIGSPFVRAERRPARDEEEVRGQAPRRVRLEHVVLEDEVVCVGPVVRDLTLVVVAHHVGHRSSVVEQYGVEPGCALQYCARPTLRLATKPSILPPSMSAIASRARAARRDCCSAVSWNGLTQWPRPEGRDAGQRARIAGQPGDSVGARIRAEVGVERAVLLHDDHDVADLVDPPHGNPRVCWTPSTPIRSLLERHVSGPGIGSSRAAGSGNCACRRRLYQLQRLPRFKGLPRTVLQPRPRRLEGERGGRREAAGLGESGGGVVVESGVGEGAGEAGSDVDAEAWAAARPLAVAGVGFPGRGLGRPVLPEAGFDLRALDVEADPPFRAGSARGQESAAAQGQRAAAAGVDDPVQRPLEAPAVVWVITAV